MRCIAGDLAIITGVPKHMGLISEGDYKSAILGILGRLVKVVTLVESNVWALESPVLINFPSVIVHLDAIEDMFLTPIRGDLLADEIPIETNVPEALQLALGIESRVWA